MISIHLFCVYFVILKIITKKNFIFYIRLHISKKGAYRAFATLVNLLLNQ